MSADAHSTYRRFLAAGVLGSVFSSIAWVTEQEAVIRLSPLTVAAVAPLVASVIMAPYAFRYRHLPSREELLRLWRPFLAVLLLRNVFGFLVFTSALTMTSSVKVMFLTKVEPYVVLFLHWLLYHEKVARNDLLLLAVHVAGAVLLSTGGEFSLEIEQFGDVLILLGVVTNSLMYRPGRVLSEAWGPAVVTTLGSFCTGVLLLPFSLIFEAGDFSLSGAEAIGWAYLMLTVVLFYIISSTLWFYSLKGIEPWLNSALRCVGPVIAAPIAWLCFSRPLGPVQLLGAAVVIGTSILLVRSAEPKVPANTAVESESTVRPRS